MINNYINNLKMLGNMKSLEGDVRKSYKLLFANALYEWRGDNKQKLLYEIDLLDIILRDKFFKWFYQNIHPQIEALVRKETDLSDRK